MTILTKRDMKNVAKYLATLQVLTRKYVDDPDHFYAMTEALAELADKVGGVQLTRMVRGLITKWDAMGQEARDDSY